MSLGCGVIKENPFTIVLHEHYVIRENPFMIVPLDRVVIREIMTVPLDRDVIRENPYTIGPLSNPSRFCHLILVLSEKSHHDCATESWFYLRKIPSRLCHLILVLSEESVHNCATEWWCYLRKVRKKATTRNAITIVPLDHGVIMVTRS